VPLRRKHDNKVNRFIGISWGCPGLGSEPGWSWLHLFSHFQHFTAEPQRLPVYRHFLKGKKNEKTLTHSGFAQSKSKTVQARNIRSDNSVNYFFFAIDPSLQHAPLVTLEEDEDVCSHLAVLDVAGHPRICRQVSVLRISNFGRQLFGHNSVHTNTTNIQFLENYRQ
jgi:hypothetical protein